MKQFKGIFTALLTPFDENGCVNEKVLQRHIDNLLQRGVTGFYVCGSTAEVFLLSHEERKRLMKLCAEAAAGRCTMIAQIGDCSTERAMEYAKYAEELGYDAISAVSPFYYKFGFDEIKQYFLSIADAVNLPMIIYHYPSNSGVSLSAEQIGELFADERFIGAKLTCNDMLLMKQIKNRFPNKILYNGFDEIFLSGLAAGADGAIGGTFNIMPEKFIGILEHWKNARIPEAQSLQNEAYRVISAMIPFGVLQSGKAILEKQGYAFGDAKAPFAVLSEAQKQELYTLVADML